MNRQVTFRYGIQGNICVTLLLEIYLPVDALTEAVAEFHIDDVLVLAAAKLSAVFL